MTVQRIRERDERSLDHLVNLLLDPHRTRPVAVVSTRSNGAPSSIDADSVAAATSGNAETWVVPTGTLTYRMRDLLTDGAHVYGGAGRVYPAGAEWLQDLHLAPLRLAFDDREGARATKLLIEDIQRLAHATGAPSSNSSIAERVDVDLAAFQLDLASEQDPASSAPHGALRDALLTIETRNATIRGLKQTLDTERRQHAVDLGQLRESSRTAASVRQPRVKASRVAVAPARAGLRLDAFVRPEDSVRHAVLEAWVERVPATEKDDRPLPEYQVGMRFASSLEALDTGQFAKAMKCVVDVLTNLSRDLPGRSVHPLRTNDTGNAPVVTRADGSVCFRAAIERSTASARRLHYWRLPDGTLELERVVTHDDVDP